MCLEEVVLSLPEVVLGLGAVSFEVRVLGLGRHISGL